MVQQNKYSSRDIINYEKKEDFPITLLVYQPLSRPFIYILVNYTNISPNTITYLSLLLSYVAGICILFSNVHLYIRILAAILIHFPLILDIVDGSVARIAKKTSKFGDWLDKFVLGRVQDMWYLSITFYFIAQDELYYGLISIATVVSCKLVKLLSIYSDFRESIYAQDFISYFLFRRFGYRKINAWGKEGYIIFGSMYEFYEGFVISLGILLGYLKVVLILLLVYYSIDVLMTSLYIFFKREYIKRISNLSFMKKLNLIIFLILWIILIIMSLVARQQTHIQKLLDIIIINNTIKYVYATLFLTLYFSLVSVYIAYKYFMRYNYEEL